MNTMSLEMRSATSINKKEENTRIHIIARVVNDKKCYSLMQI